MKLSNMLFLFIFSLHVSCNNDDTNMGNKNNLNVEKLTLNGFENWKVSNINPSIELKLNLPINKISSKFFKLFQNGVEVNTSINYTNNDSNVIIKPQAPLLYSQKCEFYISTSLKAVSGDSLPSEIRKNFITEIDSTPKFPIITNGALLTKIQQQTFKYFWDFGHPVSGMSRERNSSGDLVTSGGTGFGIMSIIVGVENNFISRSEARVRLNTMVDFLTNKAERFHGVYPHWLNGATGKTIPFSTKDDGGDLVETSYLMAGLLCAKEYFNNNTDEEIDLREKIQKLWEEVEWNWHTKNNEKVLYWHWSPKYNWEMNHQIRGWNEALITYILAASSPTFPINKEVYENGWAINGNIKNGKTFYNTTLPLGPDLGGPLFFSHYTFLGIDPRNLKDQYAAYFTQVVNHSKINYSYCVANPRGFYGYSEQCWGLTASDTKNGYTAHSPTNDLGVITPTAALSSFPFTPEESLKAAKFFYYTLGDKIFKEHGFVDAFRLDDIWIADSFLAIDQGPIIVMIENYKTGLIWNYTMKNLNVKNGLDKLGFSY